MPTRATLIAGGRGHRVAGSQMISACRLPHHLRVPHVCMDVLHLLWQSIGERKTIRRTFVRAMDFADPANRQRKERVE